MRRDEHEDGSEEQKKRGRQEDNKKRIVRRERETRIKRWGKLEDYGGESNRKSGKISRPPS